MLMLGFAAEFEIDRPTTETGWIALVFGVVFLLFVLNEGVHTATKKTYHPLKRNAFFFLVLLVLVFFAANRENWGSDPLVEVEVLDEVGVNGVSAETDPDHHVVDSDHSHDYDYDSGG